MISFGDGPPLTFVASVAWIISRDAKLTEEIDAIAMANGFDAACDALRKRFDWGEIFAGFEQLRDALDGGEINTIHEDGTCG